MDAATRELDSSFVNTMDDGGSGESTVTRIGSSVPAPAARDRLSLLLEVAESIHRAADKQALAEAVLTAAVTGTGFTNAAWLGPLGDDGRIQVAASRGAVEHDSAAPQLSRTLIRQAAKTGEPVSIARDGEQLVSAVSIAQLGIDDAICVPIKLDAAVSGFLYLDRRGTDMTMVGQTGQSNEFACALGRLAAAALQNIKCHELEQRTKLMESDLNSAAEVQRWILPNGNGTVGPFHYVGECRPGRTISGDFFDVIPFANGRVAVTLGDATGKGAGASMLITTGQGFLHAALQANGQLDQAVNALNRYLHDHCEGNRFVTLWAAVIDPEAQQLSYVDAGHSFAVLMSGDG